MEKVSKAIQLDLQSHFLGWYEVGAPPTIHTNLVHLQSTHM